MSSAIDLQRDARDASVAHERHVSALPSIGVASRRLVVFTGDLNYAVRANVVEIDRRIPGLTWLIVVAAPRKTILAVIKRQGLNLRRNGWRWIPFVIRDLVRRMSRRHVAIVRSGRPGVECTGERFRRRPNVQLLVVEDLHSPATLDVVRAFAPDLGLSLAAPILRPALFSIPMLGTINLHKGKLPDYRGMPPAFWELWNQEAEVGCSVHKVDAGLDTGEILSSTVIPCEQYSDVRGLQLRLERVGISMVCEATRNALAGRSRPVAQRAAGRTFRKPSLVQVAQLERQITNRCPPRGPFVKKLAKDVAHRLVKRAWVCGIRSLFKPRITILLYHRVADDARDNLTVGIAQFDRQMEILRHECDIWTLDEVISHVFIPPSDRPIVCVTFDDGYWDNRAYAAPILLRHAVPATFFVSTGIVGTDQPFAHDVRRNNALPRAMTWDEVGELHREGFSIGSHTVTHVDCASASEESVRDELITSYSTLRSRLGIEHVHFAYPFGGREHMTPKRMQLVKEVGFASCLSAYGGSNVGRIDPYDLRRIAISWPISDSSFRIACLGLS